MIVGSVDASAAPNYGGASLFKKLRISDIPQTESSGNSFGPDPNGFTICFSKSMSQNNTPRTPTFCSQTTNWRPPDSNTSRSPSRTTAIRSGFRERPHSPHRSTALGRLFRASATSTAGPATGVAALAAPGVAVGCSTTGGSALYGPRIVFPKGSVARRCDNNCPSRAAAGWFGSPRRLTVRKAPGAETRVAGPLETTGAGSANAGSSDVKKAKTHPSLGTFNHCRKQSVPALPFLA